MEEKDLIKEICEKQNFDKMLLKIKGENIKISKAFESIDNNNKIDKDLKIKIYEKIIDYIDNMNKCYQENIKDVFVLGIKETIKELETKNFSLDEIHSGNRKIKVIIADDDMGMRDLVTGTLKKHEDIEILGIAKNDEEEIQLIENLKPSIVITDLMRNHRYTGLDIIKQYEAKDSGPAFLVISSDDREAIISYDIKKIKGYIKKPLRDYEKIYNELKRINKEIQDEAYLKWKQDHFYKPILNLKKAFSFQERRDLKRLGIKLKNKNYTEHELECFWMDFLAYYDDPEDELSEEEKKYIKPLENTKVSRKVYNDLAKKVEDILKTI